MEHGATETYLDDVSLLLMTAAAKALFVMRGAWLCMAGLGLLVVTLLPLQAQ